MTDRTRFGAYISVVGAIITLAVNFALIPIIGYRGSALATLAAYAVMMLVSYFYGRKYYPIPYNLKKIGVSFVFSVIFSLVFFYKFRENYVVGIAMLIVFLGIVYWLEKNTIRQLLNSKKTS